MTEERIFSDHRQETRLKSEYQERIGEGSTEGIVYVSISLRRRRVASCT
jgi:hypothetical protein